MKHRTQVTCNCSAYNFPHRIGGGKCNGSSWAGSYRLILGECCATCNCNNTGESGAGGDRKDTCDVVGGIETYKLCEGYQDHLHGQPVIRVSMTEEQYFKFEYGDEFYEYVE